MLRDDILKYYPKRFAEWSILSFVTSLLVCSIIYSSRMMPLYLWCFGLVSVFMFFYGSNKYSKEWLFFSEKTFSKHVIYVGFAIRLVYVIFIYFLNNALYGKPMEVVSLDADYYVPCAWESASLVLDGYCADAVIIPKGIMGEFNIFDIWSLWMDMRLNITDCGYQYYLMLVYVLTGQISKFIIPLILKALWGSLTCLLIYRVARRHFREDVAKLASIFCLLQPNMIWWCGSMMKETEMVLLFLLFIDRADAFIENEHKSLQAIIIVVLLGIVMYAFRAALCVVEFVALFMAIVIMDNKIISVSKKIIAGIALALIIGVTYGGQLINEVREMHETVVSDHQKTNMEWRAQRENGNKFAIYAKATIFAPLIFAIPFPTLTYTHKDQEMLMQVAGGNFVKNVLSFFVILTFFSFVLSGEWRNHVFLITVLIGYLLALILSEFAQSGRFHMPAIPLEMMFAAYALCNITPRQTRWFKYVLIAEVFICIGWQWFKLAGQGLI